MTKEKLSKMSATSGRFFGIEKKDGQQINARFISESPHYVNVYNRNAKSIVKLAKSSIIGLRIDGTEIK